MNEHVMSIFVILSHSDVDVLVCFGSLSIITHHSTTSMFDVGMMLFL